MSGQQPSPPLPPVASGPAAFPPVGDVVTDDREMLRHLLTWMTDHGGGHGPFPECRLDSCPSCQAAHLLNSRVVPW